MASQLLFCNIGWMEHYQGIADDDREPAGGGDNPEKGEVCNFRPYGGKMYGYVSGGRHRTINIDRLGATENDSVDGVDVVWTATQANVGKCIVGWYQDARVFRHHQRLPQRSPYPHYNILANEENCTLLPVEDRKTRVDRRTRSVWFAAEADARSVRATARRLIKQGHALDATSFQAAAAKLVGHVPSRPPGCQRPRHIRGTTVMYSRSAEVHAWILQEAKGRCELCGVAAPFKRATTRQPYLEVHHVETLANGGADVPENAVALCPNCHRRAHHGNRKNVAKTLKTRLLSRGY